LFLLFISLFYHKKYILLIAIKYNLSAVAKLLRLLYFDSRKNNSLLFLNTQNKTERNSVIPNIEI